MTYGRRDPFYYAMGLWLVWTASHVAGRFVPFSAGPAGPFAEELHISQTTAHTHIGRIYAKTGLHSRQEILDYVRNHAD